MYVYVFRYNQIFIRIKVIIKIFCIYIDEMDNLDLFIIRYDNNQNGSCWGGSLVATIKEFKAWRQFPSCRRSS